MKKVIFGILLVGFTYISGYSQTEKGNVLLGGSASISKHSSSDNTLITFLPNLGFFAAKNFALGSTLGYSKSNSTSNFSIGPFARAYFGSNENAKLFVQGDFSYNALSRSGSTQTLTGYGGRIGYAAFINNHTALEFSGNYSHLQDNGYILSFLIGFQIHFSK